MPERPSEKDADNLHKTERKMPKHSVREGSQKYSFRETGGEVRGGRLQNTPPEELPSEKICGNILRKGMPATLVRDSGNRSSERHAGNTSLREACWDQVIREKSAGNMRLREEPRGHLSERGVGNTHQKEG